jgi:hypothetical protein
MPESDPSNGSDPSPARDRAVAATAADVRGIARLAVDAVGGVTGIVEAMHATIARPTWPIGGRGARRTSGLTGFVYAAVRATTRATGAGLDGLLAAIETLLATRGADLAGTPPSARREALLAAVNGLWGDHLAATGNPLAIRTALRVDGRPFDPEVDPLPGDGRSVLVLVHGLCMNDLQWRRDGHDHGEALARDLGWTVVRAHYDSGRHVADNGRDLSEVLESALRRWPVPVERVAILGHSMGGLVARSACVAAAATDARWLHSLSALVFLGTPHHGAPLERGGHLIDRLLGASPYAAPLARIGKARSAGITDLRHGFVRDEDRAGDDRFGTAHDTRVPTPLPAGVPAWVVAATTARRPGGLHDRVVGDGLVPVPSALGDHPDPAFALGVPPERRLVVASANHWDLLSRPEVYACLRRWLSPAGPAVTPPAPAAAA